MSPWLWFLAGLLFAWLPAVFALGLTLIFDLRTERDEDKYWRGETELLRDAWRQEILTTRCYGIPLALSEFPTEDREVLEAATPPLDL